MSSTRYEARAILQHLKILFDGVSLNEWSNGSIIKQRPSAFASNKHTITFDVCFRNDAGQVT